MEIGFVVPGAGADGAAACQALRDGIADLATELRRHGHAAVVAELDETWWMVPPSAAVEQALALVDALDGCAAVVDHSTAWAALARRAGATVPVLAASTLPGSQDAERSFPDHGLPALDPVDLAPGHGAGGYVVVAEARLAPGDEISGVPAVVLPADADRRERAALLADAVAFIAPEGATGGWPAVEALACATPVVALEGSAAAEVVTDGVNGVVVSTPTGLADGVARAASLDRWACRHAACERFSVERRAQDLIAAARSIGVRPDRSALGATPSTAASNDRRELAASTS